MCTVKIYTAYLTKLSLWHILPQTPQRIPIWRMSVPVDVNGLRACATLSMSVGHSNERSRVCGRSNARRVELWLCPHLREASPWELPYKQSRTRVADLKTYHEYSVLCCHQSSLQSFMQQLSKALVILANLNPFDSIDNLCLYRTQHPDCCIHILQSNLHYRRSQIDINIALVREDMSQIMCFPASHTPHYTL